MARKEPTFWSELFRASRYKPNQGRLARQLTAAALGLIIGVGAYMLSQGPLSSSNVPLRVGFPSLLAAAGAWFIFRLVNYPSFAEFLISVEGEMNKVSWASKQELYRATIVVLSSMCFLGLVLYVYDFMWMWVLTSIGVLSLGGPPTG